MKPFGAPACPRGLRVAPVRFLGTDPVGFKGFFSLSLAAETNEKKNKDRNAHTAPGRRSLAAWRSLRGTGSWLRPASTPLRTWSRPYAGPGQSHSPPVPPQIRRPPPPIPRCTRLPGEDLCQRQAKVGAGYKSLLFGEHGMKYNYNLAAPLRKQTSPRSAPPRSGSISGL